MWVLYDLTGPPAWLANSPRIVQVAPLATAVLLALGFGWITGGRAAGWVGADRLGRLLSTRPKTTDLGKHGYPILTAQRILLSVTRSSIGSVCALRADLFDNHAT